MSTRQGGELVVGEEPKSRWPRPVRRLITGRVVLVTALAVTTTAYRTLRPAVTSTGATRPVPSAEPIKSIQYGELAAAPLIVDGTLRIYAEQRRVYADTPVTAVRVMTPHWTYRSWPNEVVAVTTVEKSTAGGNVSGVITKWSDGSVVGLNAVTGEVIWQGKVEPVPGHTFAGRRTGASTVYNPGDMFVTSSAITKRPIVIVTGKNQASAFDPWTGAALWTNTFLEHPDQGCHDFDWTGETTYFVKDSCAQPAVLAIYDAATGLQLNQWRPPGASIGPPSVTNWLLEPSSCQLGRSNCALFKAAATGDAVSFTAASSGLGRITPAYYKAAPPGVVTPLPFVDKDTVFEVDDTIVEQVVTDYIWAYSMSTGQRRWMSEVAGTLIAADKQNVYIVNRDYQLLVLNTETGAVTSSTELRIRPEDRFVFKMTYLHDGYLVVERLQTFDVDETDERYYFSATPVIVVGV